MSNIRIDNIAPSAGGTYRNAPRGIAAAWVNFNGTSTVAIRDSVNVGSITDNGTGQYGVNFTNSFANTNYCSTIMSNGGSSGNVQAPYNNPINAAVGTHNMGTRRTDTMNSIDCEGANFAYLGDLA
jgi:hypothetical protein